MRPSPLTRSLESRRHSLRSASRATRCVLVDFARAQRADRRDSGARRDELREDAAVGDFLVDEIWYRDGAPGGCDHGSNLSNGVRVLIGS